MSSCCRSAAEGPAEQGQVGGQERGQQPRPGLRQQGQEGRVPGQARRQQGQGAHCIVQRCNKLQCMAPVSGRCTELHGRHLVASLLDPHPPVSQADVFNPAREFALQVTALLLHKRAVMCTNDAITHAALHTRFPETHSYILLQAEKAKKKLPLGTIDYTGLQQNVSAASCQLWTVCTGRHA